MLLLSYSVDASSLANRRMLLESAPILDAGLARPRT